MAEDQNSANESADSEFEALKKVWENVRKETELPDDFKGFVDAVVTRVYTHPILQSQFRYEEEDYKSDKCRLVRFDYLCEALWTMTHNISENETRKGWDVVSGRLGDIIQAVIGQTLDLFARKGGWAGFASKASKAFALSEWVTPVLRCDKELQKRVDWLRKKALKQRPNQRRMRNVLVRY